MIIDDVMTDKITLHGLGFIQVQLEGNQWLHVWHPELPRRSCFQHSAIHDHRFDFVSTILVGSMANYEFEFEQVGQGEGGFIQYLHEGKRLPNGGRPWMPDGDIKLSLNRSFEISAGQIYTSKAYVFHMTKPLGSGKVATIMRKTDEFSRGAHSTCRVGIEPDSTFDRYQWSTTKLWEIVSDVLLNLKVKQ